MKINQICAILKQELYENGYEYGFYYDGNKYKPNFEKGFDTEYFNLSNTIYRIQNPSDTMKEKIGTCIDTVVVMRTILENIGVPYKIWLIYQPEKRKEHTILTFEAEGKTVYLELTPQSNKPWYGREIIYDNVQSFIDEYKNQNCDVFDITDKIIIGESSNSLLRCAGLKP